MFSSYVLNPLVFYLLVVIILVLVSILVNGFIITVNLRDWLKGRSLSPVDQILVALSFSNAGLSYIFGNYIFFVFLWPRFFLVDFAFPVAFAVMLFLTLSSSWLAAWLCLYFFMKIIHFTSSFLVKLRLTIDAAVPWLIVFSEVVSSSSTVPVIWSFTRPLPHNSTTCNITCPIVPFRLTSMYYIFALGFSSISALSLVLVSTVCIIWSLYGHMYRMKKTMSSEEYSRIRGHRKAAQTVMSLLVIYLVFYTMYVLMSTVFTSDDFSIHFWITLWVLLCTPPAMSLVLILGNSKLSLAVQEIWHRSSPLD